MNNKQKQLAALECYKSAFDGKEKTVQEIADMLGKSCNTVFKAISRYAESGIVMNTGKTVVQNNSKRNQFLYRFIGVQK